MFRFGPKQVIQSQKRIKLMQRNTNNSNPRDDILQLEIACKAFVKRKEVTGGESYLIITHTKLTQNAYTHSRFDLLGKRTSTESISAQQVLQQGHPKERKERATLNP